MAVPNTWVGEYERRYKEAQQAYLDAGLDPAEARNLACEEADTWLRFAEPDWL